MRRRHPLEIRIPVAPTAAFYLNVRLAALSLRALGEPYASARIVVSVDGDIPIERIIADAPWSRDFPIEWFVVPPAGAKGGHEAGAALDRFPTWPDARAVIHCDADVCLVAPIDDLLRRLDTEKPVLAGVMAHQSPFARDPAVNDATWRQIFDHCGLKDVALDHRYALIDTAVCGRCPVYFNAGFLAFNEAAWARIAPLLQRSIASVRGILERSVDPIYAIQVGLAVAILQSGIEPIVLDLGFNCPNVDDVFDRCPDLIRNLRVIHYQRRDEFDRHTFLASEDALAAFRAAPFQGRVNRIFQKHVDAVWVGGPS